MIDDTNFYKHLSNYHKQGKNKKRKSATIPTDIDYIGMKFKTSYSPVVYTVREYTSAVGILIIEHEIKPGVVSKLPIVLSRFKKSISNGEWIIVE
jgi:hypothetical protein